ncbi:MAG: two-component regulator propeller domain-containing protein [candidate division KSB1 bacterium]|nr:two-component regulator propeller domain-containing protein [candidate division KSB1 bacterium]
MRRPPPSLLFQRGRWLRHFSLLFYIMAAAVSSVHPQIVHKPVRHFSINDGLSQNNVTAILQDHSGFLWIGTLDGLNRYDGYAFLTFRHLPGDSNSLSLSSHTISSLAEDAQGRLWIGTMSHGLNQMDLLTGRIHVYVHSPDDPFSLPDNRIRALVVTPDGRLCIGTRHRGLVVFDLESRRFTTIRLQISGTTEEPPLHIRSLLFDRRGNLWIGSASRGLFVLRLPAKGVARTEIVPAVHIAKRARGVSHNRIEALSEDAQGRIWAGTYGAGIDIFQIDSIATPLSARHITKVEHLGHKPPIQGTLADNTIEAIYCDHEGKMWIGTAHGGLSCYDPATGKTLTYRNEVDNPQSLSFNNIDALFEDASHNLWVGTWGGGLNKIDLKPIKFHTTRHIRKTDNRPTHDYIRAVAEDPAGNIWLGSAGGSLGRIHAREGRIDHFAHNAVGAATLRKDDVRSILFDREGNLWVGTYGSGVAFLPARALERAQHGTADLRFQPFVHQPGEKNRLSNNFIWCLQQDQRGDIWIGTSGGLNIFNTATRQIRHFRHDPDDPGSLSNDIVRTIYLDATGTLWIGTYRGLNRFNREEQRFIRYLHDPNAPNSLSHNSITAIVADSAGVLWIGTMGGGLNRFEPQKEQFRQYHLAHGLPNMFVHALLFDERGRLWLSTNRGLSVFDDRLPDGKKFRNYTVDDGLQSNEFNAGAAFKGHDGTLYFGGIHGLNFFHPERLQDNPFEPPVVLTDFKVFNKSRRFALALAELSEITLSHSDDFFAFEFAALDFTVPARNRYAYKLEGFDSDWIEAGHRRYAGYTNINPGSYTFRVRASNNDGVWNEDGLAVKVVVIPPYWQKWWFRVLVLLAGGGLLFLMVFYRMRRLQLEKEAQEAFSRKLVTTQEQERRRLAGELHDGLGQELIIINNLIQQRMLQNRETPETVQALQNLSKKVVAAINEVRQLSSRLHPHLLERLGLVRAMEAMVDKIAGASQIAISLDLQALPPLSPEMELNLYRILQEILNNAIKHSQATEMTISMKTVGDRLRIVARDNGRGVAPDRLQRTQGLGLAGIRHRVKTMHGELRIQSQPGAGTRIILSFPVQGDMPRQTGEG